MKKIVKLLVVLTMGISLIIGCFAATGCKEEDKESSAVSAFDLIREDFAKNKEKEDDETGREHLEIPADADTIEIENETWCVVREFNDFRQKEYNYPDMPKLRSQRNYILANDIELICDGTDCCLWLNFTGKLDGNNYKITSSEANGGRKALFEDIENATIENLIFSASDGYLRAAEITNYSFIAADTAKKNCIIRNCINYFQHNLKKEYRSSIKYWVTINGFVSIMRNNTLIENCINYGDSYSSCGGIVNYVENSTVSGCKNYGNLASEGGIVDRISGDTVIENCENYGNIVSKACGTGGVVGRPYRIGHIQMFNYFNTDFDGLKEYYTENQIVRNCKNYGDIYLLRGENEKRFEETDHGAPSNGYSDSENKTIYGIGGVAGSISKVENCINEGNFYGFENMGNNIKVNFMGGVVGAARYVTNCENKGKIEVQKGRGNYVGDIYGWLENK